MIVLDNLRSFCCFPMKRSCYYCYSCYSCYYYFYYLICPVLPHYELIVVKAKRSIMRASS